jgi:hypothetical protein
MQKWHVSKPIGAGRAVHKQTRHSQMVMSALPPKADMAQHGDDVRFGSKADVTLLNFDVRFTPESGHSAARS